MSGFTFERLAKSKQGLLVSAVALVAGAAATWLCVADMLVFRQLDVSLRVHPLTAVATCGPGVFGLLLLMAAGLIAFGRDLGAPVYWAALFVGAGVLAVQTCDYIGVSRYPGEDAWIQWIYPDYGMPPFWKVMQVAVLGLLVLVGRWIPEREAVALR